MAGLNGARFDAGSFQLAGQSIGSGAAFARLTLLSFVLIALPNSQAMVAWFGAQLSAVASSPAVTLINRRISARLIAPVTAGASAIVFFVSLALIGRKAEFLYFQF